MAELSHRLHSERVLKGQQIKDLLIKVVFICVPAVELVMASKEFECHGSTPEGSMQNHAYSLPTRFDFLITAHVYSEEESVP